MAETYSFQAEIKKVLDLMIHSVYSNKEVFLREIISNASDAIDKRKYVALTKPELAATDHSYFIKVIPDATQRTIKIIDNGIGMTKEEVIENIGTIAKSGTKQFVEMAKQLKENPELIGQFGVGFYSTFMVADKVQVLTKPATGELATLWESSGDGTYSIQTAQKEEVGTEITLHLKPFETNDEGETEDFTEEYFIKKIIQKYSDFIAYPIQLQVTRYEYDNEGKVIHGKTKTEFETVNSQKALWTRAPSEVTKEEYTEFYRQLAHDWNEPLRSIHYRAEGNIEFQSLLFIPSKRPFNFNTIDAKKGLNLYVKKVFILSNSEDLIPEYLRFVKGLVDSSDLSLNISREMLQKDQQVAAIKKNIVTKILNTLTDMQTKEREVYEGFWQNFGVVLKEGIPTDTNNHPKLADLLLFKTTAHDGFTTLKEYVDRKKPNQKEIFFLTGESIEQLRSSPHLEVLKEKGYEVILMSDDIDEWVVGHLPQYKDLSLKSIAKGDLVLDETEKEELDKKKQELSEKYKEVISSLKEALKEEVQDVRVSSRLKDSPVVLVSDENDMSANMQRIIAQHKGETFKPKRILEINPNHAIFEKMKQAKPEEQKDWADLFYGQALLTEGSQVPDPVKFSNQINKLVLGSLH